MQDPILLQYLQSINDKVCSIDEKLDKQGDRIGSLEQTRATQRGIMALGGACVTFLSGIAAWIGASHK